MPIARLIVVACVIPLLLACNKTPAAKLSTHVVNLWMNGERVGEESATSTTVGQQVTTDIRTTLSGPPELHIDGRLVLERGRPTSLRVSAGTPSPWSPALDVTVTPDRTDVFPVRDPLPIYVLSALVRRSIVSARRSFQTLPEGSVTISVCQGPEGPFPDAICHVVSGLSSGPALVWLDTRQQLAAAVVTTPLGVILASTPDRDDAHAALLKRFDVYSAP